MAAATGLNRYIQFFRFHFQLEDIDRAPDPNLIYRKEMVERVVLKFFAKLSV